MTTAYGVTPAGFVVKPLTVIQAEITADILGIIDPAIDVAPDQPLGQLVGIFAAKVSEVWELEAVAYNATNRAAAEDALLDNIGALNGTTREGQQSSTVPCTVGFSLAGTYAAGALVAFLAPPYSATIQFANVNQIVVPSTSNDGSGQPIGPTHLYTVTGALFESTVAGPDFGNALIAADGASGVPQLTQMVPVSGWASVGDNGAVTVGMLEEQDTPYRVRQVEDLSAPGASTMAAIKAAILEALQNAPIVPSLATVEMYENTSLVPDPMTGLPGKAFMAVVFDGTDTGVQAQDDPLIAQAIVNNKPAGGQSYGTTSGSAPDAQGVTRTVYWTRPTAVPVYLSITLSVAAGLTTPEQNAIGGLVADAIIAASQGQPFTMYGSAFTPAAGAQTTLVPGGELVAMAFRAIAMGQAGVLDVPAFTLGTSPTPAGTGNLKFTFDELATLTVGNIVFSYAGLT